jgi:hypothetical protein
MTWDSRVALRYTIMDFFCKSFVVSEKEIDRRYLKRQFSVNILHYVNGNMN